MTIGWAFFSWYNIVVFPVTESPRFKRGFTASICLIVVYLSIFITGYLLWQRDIRNGVYQRAIEQEENEEALNEKNLEADGRSEKIAEPDGTIVHHDEVKK